MVLYLARLGIGHSVINLMGQIGIFVRCGGWCYLVITLVTSSITGRHWGVSLTTRDTRDLQLCALCSVLTPDMFCSKPGQVSMTVGARGRAGYIPSQYNTKTKSSPGGILPVPVKTKKINFEARSGDNEPQEPELCTNLESREREGKCHLPWS